MRGKIYLDFRNNQLRKKGYPVKVSISGNGKRKVFVLQHYTSAENWNFEKQEPINDKKLLFFIRRKKLQLDELIFNSQSGKRISLETVKNILLDLQQDVTDISFLDFYKLFITELKTKNRYGNAYAYEVALNQLEKFRAKLDFSEINYTLLNDFKTIQFGKENSKNTIHTYLRKYRAVYNEAVRRKLIIDKKPFDGIFKGITVKSNRTKKKHLLKKTIQFLENVENLSVSQQRALDLFLLQFYFGGQDLIDIYYLESNKIKNKRVFFVRDKLGEDGYQFDLRITKKAAKIIDKYSEPGAFVFPWRKSYEGYKTFRNNMRRSLQLIQDAFDIQVQPLGGKLGAKVARHTFATIGKQLFIETDLLRELMGHERNDVDTIYKDKYPQEIRDAAQLKIIE